MSVPKVMPRVWPFRLLMLLLACGIVLPAGLLVGRVEFDLVYLAAIPVAAALLHNKPLKLLAVPAIGLGMTFLFYWQMQMFRCPGAGLAAFDWLGLLVHSLVMTGLVLILLGVDSSAAAALRRLLTRAPSLDNRRPGKLIVLIARLLLIWLVTIPWLFVFLQTHRPKMNYPERPTGDYRESRVDGLLLWHQPPTTQSNVVVLLCHGIGGDQGDMGFHREMFHEMGFHVVSFDLPGLGQSAGVATTFGVREGGAVLQVARWARQHADRGPGRPILIGLGTSMGGTSLLLAAEREPALFDGLIIDSAYARLGDMAEFQLRRVPGVAAWPMRTVGRLFMAAELGAPIENVDAIRDIRRLDGMPKLFIHGTADQVVPVEQGRELFAAAGGDKRMIEFPDVGHVQSIVMELPSYRQAAGRLLCLATSQSE